MELAFEVFLTLFVFGVAALFMALYTTDFRLSDRAIIIAAAPYAIFVGGALLYETVYVAAAIVFLYSCMFILNQRGAKVKRVV